MSNIFKFKEVTETISRYKRNQRDFSEISFRYLDQAKLTNQERRLAEYITVSPNVPEAILSNYAIRLLWQRSIGNSTLKHWGKELARGKLKLLHISITDYAWATGTKHTVIGLAMMKAKVRNLFSYYNPSHISAIEIKAFDNVYAPNPQHGRCIFPHIHSLCVVDADSKLADRSTEKIEEILSKRFTPPLMKDKYKEAAAVVVKPVAATLSDLATVAVYAGKRPEIDVLRNNKREKIFTHDTTGRRNQILRLTEIMSQLETRELWFSGKAGKSVLADARKSMEQQINSRLRPRTHCFGKADVTRFWKQFKELDGWYSLPPIEWH